MYETYNEPLQVSWSGTIKPYHEQVIPVIRAHTSNVVILGTKTWSQDVDEASQDPVNGQSLAYTIHFYANTHRGELRNKVSAALSNGVAIFATEWGTCSADGNGQLDLGETQTWLNFFSQHHIGDANWAVSDKSEACSAMQPGASGNGGWSESQLADSGRFVRAAIRGDSGNNPGPTPGGGCCRFGADCGDCGEDGTGWCHLSASNCAECTGSFDSSASAPSCGGVPTPPSPTPPTPPSPTPGGGCCMFGADCGDCGLDGTGWCHQSASNCATCTGSFNPSASAPNCNGGGSPAPPTPPSNAPAGSVVEQHGTLSVSGNKIVDKNGDPVRLRGMSLFWSQWMPQYWNRAAIEWLASDWKITVIRCAMGIEHGGYLENPGAEKGRMEAVVDAAIAISIYVIIDWHDHHAEQHTNQAKGFFSEMASKYGSYSNVMYETYNEPLQVSWSGTIKPYHQQVIPVIRQHTSCPIILGTRAWSQDIDEAARDPVSGQNLAYTIHFYANTHRGELRNKVSSALSTGVAVFATEWGTCSADGNGQLDLGETQTWLNFFAQHHIGDANWAVSDKSEACSALQPGASGNGGWSQLTQSGSFVRGSIRGDGGGSPGGGCCRFGADCGDCGEDGTGWCHQSASNCAICTGSFDSSASTPSCGGGGSPAPSPPSTGGQCCYGAGCTSCNGAGEYCSSSRGACEGDCGGSYCSGM